uniref:UspA domain-containing protein n=1 Tax=Dunaliella tertiolecta TaxID=3047 RepID=A0A7S3QZE4_DUNTE
MLRNILVSVDRSLASQRCVSFAINHVYRHGDVIHLLHVIPLGTENVIPLGMDASELMEVGVGVTEPNKEKQKVIDEDAKKYLLENFVPHLEAAQVPYQVEVVRFSLDNESIGTVVCPIGIREAIQGNQ